METMKKELKDAFRVYDKEGQGFITTETLRGLIGQTNKYIFCYKFTMANGTKVFFSMISHRRAAGPSDRRGAGRNH